MHFATILPARFGLLSDSIELVSRLVEEKAVEISEEFKKMLGCIELGVRVSFQRDAALAATLKLDQTLFAERNRLSQMGREGYFLRAEFGRSLAETLEKRRGLAQKALISGLRPYIKDYVVRAPETDVEVVRLEVLIEDRLEGEFILAVEDLARNSLFAPESEPLVQIIGPAPVYNFVKLSLSVESSGSGKA